MPASRRTTLLIATAVVLLAAFAVLPAPRLIVRRSPVVSDRTAGDVRRIAMAVEPDGSLHAALEVWTDSDWDVEYWSSITGLTPVARVVTVDLIEQRDAAIAVRGDRLALAWVDYDAKSGTYALQWTTKKRIDRDWAKPVAIASGPTPVRQPGVAIGPDGRSSVTYVRGGRLALAAAPDDGAAPVDVALPSIPAARPAIAVSRSGAGIAFEWAGSVWLLDRSAGGVEPARLGEGRTPAITASEDAFVVAWADRDAIQVRDAGRRHIAAPGVGDAGASIAFAGSSPVAAWLVGREVRMLKADGTTATLGGRGACCPFVAADGERTWTAWLRSRPGDAIFRDARLRFEGPAGRFTAGDRIPVVALPASH